MGYLQGVDATQAPEVGGEGRTRAIEAVAGLYRGFIGRFGATDCRTLTGCDWSNRRDIVRYMREKTYEHTCYHYLAYVLAECLGASGQA